MTRCKRLIFDSVLSCVKYRLVRMIEDVFFSRLVVSPSPCPPTDSIITLITVCRITGKIIRTKIMLITYASV